MSSPFPHVEAEPYYLYILMRNDLESMNPGKACAQSGETVFEGLIDWQNDTGKGFGTTITLEMDIRSVNDVVRRMSFVEGVLSGVVHDPTYPIRDGSVTHLIPLDTCGYVFGRRNVVQGFLREHGLMK
jgi:hypothetical protein